MGRVINISEKELKELYQRKKLTIKEIAKRYNCDVSTIRRKLRNLRILKPPSNRPLNLPKEKLRELYVIERLSIAKIAKKYKCSVYAVHKYLRKYKIKLRNLAESHIIYPKKKFSGNPIEKAYLIGFALGDLEVKKRYENSKTIQIDGGSTRIEQINLVKNLFKKYGRVWIGKPDKVRKRKVLVFLDLPSFSFLLNPMQEMSWILKNNKHFAAFLAGFVDAEGSFYVSDNKPNFQLCNNNKKIIFLIKNKLLEIGIRCSGPYRLVKQNPNHLRLRIRKQDELLQLCKLISPYLKHAKRKKDLKTVQQFILSRLCK